MMAKLSQLQRFIDMNLFYIRSEICMYNDRSFQVDKTRGKIRDQGATVSMAQVDQIEDFRSRGRGVDDPISTFFLSFFGLKLWLRKGQGQSLIFAQIRVGRLHEFSASSVKKVVRKNCIEKEL